MSEPIKYIDGAEFQERGYLQEVNRRFLHVLGLALEVRRGYAEGVREIRAAHDEASEGDDGFIVCKCGTPSPSWDTWADHYADAILAGLYPSGVPDVAIGGVWDYRDDPEGMSFAQGVLEADDAVAKARAVAEELAEKATTREQSLGYTVQPIDIGPEGDA